VKGWIKMNRKGFTLIELLAVIVILSIITIIVLPDIMKLFNGSKKDTFLIEVKSIFNSADISYMKQSYTEGDSTIFYRLNGDENKVPLNGRKQLYYYVKVTKSGNITQMLIWDGTYTLKKRDDTGIKIAELTEDDIVTDIETSSLTLDKIQQLFDY
jgi:prepilin-type N-terminal cleavage/methylation domain-containing protein